MLNEWKTKHFTHPSLDKPLEYREGTFRFKEVPRRSEFDPSVVDAMSVKELEKAWRKAD